MHLDLNSCFASVEQQANPLLRGKPVVVAAYVSPGGCVLAASVEAKKIGIKTGMRVKEARLLDRQVVVLPADPNKYREVHRRFRKLLEEYTHKVVPKSIDEFVLDLEGVSVWKEMTMEQIAMEIKRRIKEEVGDWLRVSVGIAPNNYLAKIAAGLHKPDGLDEINERNYLQIMSGLKLVDLCGIKAANAARLNRAGIFKPVDFYSKEASVLTMAFGGISGYYWYLRMRGYEIDDVLYERKSFGNSYALPQPLVSPEELAPLFLKLVEKTGRRLRRNGYRATGVHVSLLFKDRTYWHRGEKQADALYDGRDIYRAVMKILRKCPYQKPAQIIAESVFGLKKQEGNQLGLWEDMEKKESLTMALDKINEKWGEYVITPARMLGLGEKIQDRIAFGSMEDEVVVDFN